MFAVGTVVFADKFVSKKTEKLYTKLFMPCGNEVINVIAEGDQTDLVGKEVSLNVVVREGHLKLYFDGEEG